MILYLHGAGWVFGNHHTHDRLIRELAGLPPALVITAEADVLRDEGEGNADKLRDAGVPVTADRFQAIIHDFVMLNALADTNAAQGAITLAADTLRTVLSDRT